MKQNITLANFQYLFEIKIISRCNVSKQKFPFECQRHSWTNIPEVICGYDSQILSLPFGVGLEITTSGKLIYISFFYFVQDPFLKKKKNEKKGVVSFLYIREFVA